MKYCMRSSWMTRMALFGAMSRGFLLNICCSTFLQIQTISAGLGCLRIVAWAEKSLNFGLWAFSSLILSSCVIKKPLSPQHWVLSKLLARTSAQGHKYGPKIRLALFFSASWNYQGPNFAKKLYTNTMEPRSLVILLGVYSHVSSSYLLVLGFKAICDPATSVKISQIFTNAPN